MVWGTLVDMQIPSPYGVGGAVEERRTIRDDGFARKKE